MCKVILILLLSFVWVQSVYGQSFEAMAVSENLQEAVLKNTETGEQRVVRRGEVVDGWRVMEIAETHVTLGGWVEGIGAIAARIPVIVRLSPNTQRP
jgi:hypothetical protein